MMSIDHTGKLHDHDDYSFESTVGVIICILIFIIKINESNF